MPKPKTYTYPSGATLIYDKQNIFDETYVNIAFNCGARFDPKGKEGLSHLLEHMFFKGTKKYNEVQIAEQLTKLNIKMNAFTTSYLIATDFAVNNINLEKALAFNTHLIKNSDFDKDLFIKEKEVINEEIKLHKDLSNSEIMELIKLLERQPLFSKDVLGTSESLQNISTQDLIDYKNEYFIADNLIISVVSNLSFDTIKEVVGKTVANKFISMPELSVDLISSMELEFSDANYLIYTPKPDKQTCSINFLLEDKEIINFSELDYACIEYIEDAYFNGINGKLFLSLRTGKNALVYSAGFDQLDLIQLKFKCFSFLTSGNKINNCFDEIIELINNLRNNGITDVELKQIKKNALQDKNAVKKKIKFGDVYENLDNYILAGKNYITEKQFFEHLNNLTLEKVNEYFNRVYTGENIQGTITGNFDPRKPYNLIELQEKLGTNDHSDLKPQFYVPRVESVPVLETKEQNEIYMSEVIKEQMLFAENKLKNSERRRIKAESCELNKLIKSKINYGVLRNKKSKSISKNIEEIENAEMENAKSNKEKPSEKANEAEQ